MSDFQYKEIDKEGWETLDAISSADKFNRWMFDTIRPYCSGKILEIGSGIGNISQFFIEQRANITLSDIRPVYCNVLRQKFPGAVDVVEMDLTHPSFDDIYQQHIESYDAVFALNVVEHIENDQHAINNCYKLLRNGGRLVILVPAYQALYNRFDKELEHFRRYNEKKLNALLHGSGFRIVHSQYFNLMGIPGWYVSGKLQQNKTIPKGQMSLYNKMVPLFKLVDKITFNRIGLSVISVGLKQ
jgi:2-polyprenyl-3-methyl-5-hydroxy-6-metoxy-1,4-benzoquinol methylase